MKATPALLADGRLSLAFGTDTAVDFAVLHSQVQKAQPSTPTKTHTPVADAEVQGGVNAKTNFRTTANTIDLADANGDRGANLLEYVTGQNPNATTNATPSIVKSGATLEFTYNPSNAAMNDGVIFTVEWSDTLATNSWSTVGVTQATLADNGTIQTVKATIPTGNGIFARFARLKVASP